MAVVYNSGTSVGGTAVRKRVRNHLSDRGGFESRVVFLNLNMIKYMLFFQENKDRFIRTTP